MHSQALRRGTPAAMAALAVAAGVATPIIAAAPASARTAPTARVAHAEPAAALTPAKVTKKKAAPAVTKAEVNALIKAYLKQHPSTGTTGPAGPAGSAGATGAPGATGATGPDWTTGPGLAVNNDFLTLTPGLGINTDHNEVNVQTGAGLGFDGNGDLQTNVGYGLEVNSSNSVQLDPGVYQACPGLQVMQGVTESGPTCVNAGIDFYDSSGIVADSVTPTDTLSASTATVTNGTSPLQVTLDANNQPSETSTAYLVNAQLQFYAVPETEPQCNIVNASKSDAIVAAEATTVTGYGAMDIQTAVYLPKGTVLAVQCNGGGGSVDDVGGSISATAQGYQLGN